MPTKRPEIEVHSTKGTLLIIDILGLDLLHGKYDSKVTIQDFFTLDQQIKEAVSRQGGIFNGNLRSGLEVFFGSLDIANQSKQHSLDALNCAIHIQKINSQLIVQASKNHSPIFSLRIGMHAGHFTMGRIQGEKKSMLCVIGQGYMITRSLNQACNINAILYSQESARLIEEFNVRTNYDNQRKIKVIGRSEHIPGYDYDP